MEPSLSMLAWIQLTEPKVSPFKLIGGMLLDYRCSICHVLPHPHSRSSVKTSPSALSAPPSTEVETWPDMLVKFMTE